MWLLSLLGGLFRLAAALLGFARDRKLIKAGEARVTIQRLEGARNDMRKAKEAARAARSDPDVRRRLRRKYRAKD